MFYIGIVEDNKDPLKLGRLRIRVIGIHTENRSQVGSPQQFLLTEELPWATPAYPITNSSIDGISDFSSIVCGTKVFVFFLDRFKQKPVYFGVMPFILDEMPDFEQGFSDPNAEYPNEEFKNESSVSRLARNEKIDQTCVQTKKDNLSTVSVNGIDIDEPEPGYNAEYPYNRVIETPSGIIIELDSTPNAERIHIYHPSNSYTEIYPDGSKVTKTQGNDFEIILENKIMNIEGDLLLKVNGSSIIELNGATDLTCNDVATITFKDKASINAESDVTIDGAGSVTVMSDSEVNIGANSEVNIAGGIINIEGTTTTINATGILTLSSDSIVKVETNAALNIECGSCNLSSTSTVTITAAGLISLN